MSKKRKEESQWEKIGVHPNINERKFIERIYTSDVRITIQATRCLG
jgi:hypothetical protein